MLRQQYRNRSECTLPGRAGGMPVVALVGPTVPVELPLALGWFPFRVEPELPERHGIVPKTNRFLQPSAPADLRSIVTQVAGGTCRAAGLLIVDSTREDAYYYLKQIVRMGEGKGIPPLTLCDLDQTGKWAGMVHSRRRVRELARRLEALSGVQLTPDRLAVAVDRVNRARGVARRLLDLRRQRRAAISGVWALEALGAGRLMQPDSFVELMDRVLERPPARPELASRPRLLVLSATPLYHQTLHEALEEAGALIVGEDDWWGSSGVLPDIGSDAGVDLLDAVADAYAAHTPTSQRFPAHARSGWLRREVAEPDIDGVVFYVPPNDRSFGWDYPALRTIVVGEAKPALLLRSDVTQPQGRREATAQTAAFLQSVGIGRGAG